MHFALSVAVGSDGRAHVVDRLAKSTLPEPSTSNLEKACFSSTSETPRPMAAAVEQNSAKSTEPSPSASGTEGLLQGFSMPLLAADGHVEPDGDFGPHALIGERTASGLGIADLIAHASNPSRQVVRLARSLRVAQIIKEQPFALGCRSLGKAPHPKQMWRIRVKQYRNEGGERSSVRRRQAAQRHSRPENCKQKGERASASNAARCRWPGRSRSDRPRRQLLTGYAAVATGLARSERTEPSPSYLRAGGT